jgi:uncharacterized protein (TIRG00374 family)
MSVRTVVSTLTLILLAVVLYEARHSILRAWELLGQVNVWILALAVPAVMISYIAVGEMIFSYLRQKKLISHLNPFKLMRLSLELNFVNHVLPSGGASGVAYLNWRMGKLGVNMARATMAQAVRYLAGYMAATVMLGIGLLMVTIDGTVNRWIILMSAGLILSMVVSTFGLYFAVSNKNRIGKIASWLTRTGNLVVRRLTFGKKPAVLNFNHVEKYFNELHVDYVELSHDKKLIWQPFFWGLLYVSMDIAMFWVTFWAFGTYVNPATILIAYHLASVAGFLVVTPGGVGAYEWIMVTVIVMSGLAQEPAIAGIVLARTIILLVTIIFGYIFYQQAIYRYGRPKQLDTVTDS